MSKFGETDARAIQIDRSRERGDPLVPPEPADDLLDEDGMVVPALDPRFMPVLKKPTE
jgi:hypothetical protein